MNKEEFEVQVKVLDTWLVMDTYNRPNYAKNLEANLRSSGCKVRTVKISREVVTFD